jgi:hypothetical protein
MAIWPRVIKFRDGLGLTSLRDLDHKIPSGESPVYQDQETPEVCHAVLQEPEFFRFLLRIDEEFAAATRRGQCGHCGGTLHSARYPRKPRGCPPAVVEEYSWRFSFTCALCDQRATPASVRFSGRRVYLAVVLTLVSPPGSATAQGLARVLSIPMRTLSRWRAWWSGDFLRTPFWHSMRERFTTPIAAERLPQSLLERFEADTPAQRLVLLLRFLAPLSTRLVSG